MKNDHLPISQFVTGAATDLVIVALLMALAVVISSLLGGVGWHGVAEFFDTFGGRP